MFIPNWKATAGPLTIFCQPYVVPNSPSRLGEYKIKCKIAHMHSLVLRSCCGVHCAWNEWLCSHFTARSFIRNARRTLRASGCIREFLWLHRAIGVKQAAHSRYDSAIHLGYRTIVLVLRSCFCRILNAVLENRTVSSDLDGIFPLFATLAENRYVE